MSNLLTNTDFNDINRFEKELNELKSISEHYQKLLESLKESESKYRFLTENSADIVWHLDTELRFTYISPSDEKLRGYKQEEVIGRKIWDVLTPEGVMFVSERMTELKKNKSSKTTPTRFELPLISKNGSIFWSEVNVNPIVDSTGNIIGYNGVTRDITERKRYEEEINATNEKLKEINDSKDKFFSIIAHDLRSPFQGLLGVSNLLLTETDTLSKEEIKELAFLLNNSLNNQYRLLEDLLNWARMQAGKIKYQPKEIYVLEEVYNVFQMFKTNLQSKNIDVKINIDQDLTCFADSDMISMLIRNLISNAIKFTNTGGCIEISSFAQNDSVLFKVKDNGVGIEEEHLDKLFRLDMHYTSEGTNQETGSGLGLILCKDIIDKHNGKIWVESKVNEGTCFIFTLPKNNS